MRKWVLACVLLLAMAGLAGWGYFKAMQKAWIRYNEYDIRSEGSLRVGDIAPDLELASLVANSPRRVSEFYRDKPLVLIFGSYT